jgi:hypothetical protein
VPGHKTTEDQTRESPGTNPKGAGGSLFSFEVLNASMYNPITEPDDAHNAFKSRVSALNPSEERPESCYCSALPLGSGPCVPCYGRRLRLEESTRHIPNNS